VEVAAQFVVDLEWRSRAHWSLSSIKTRATMAKYESCLSTVTEWVTKIVRLLQVEELKARPDAGNDVLHLAERLRQLIAVEE
jgi:HEPN domain-containing protein